MLPLGGNLLAAGEAAPFGRILSTPPAPTPPPSPTRATYPSLSDFTSRVPEAAASGDSGSKGNKGLREPHQGKFSTHAWGQGRRWVLPGRQNTLGRYRWREAGPVRRSIGSSCPWVSQQQGRWVAWAATDPLSVHPLVKIGNSVSFVQERGEVVLALWSH